MDLSVFSPNSGKAREIETAFGRFDRYPIRTHVIMRGERIEDVMQSYTPTPLLKGDYLFVSEKIVAICQGRAWDISEIKPSRLAKLLSRFVYRSPYGIGLGSPWTMQLAIEEVGVLRLLFAAACSALTKPFGIANIIMVFIGCGLIFSGIWDLVSIFRVSQILKYTVNGVEKKVKEKSRIVDTTADDE